MTKWRSYKSISGVKVSRSPLRKLKNDTKGRNPKRKDPGKESVQVQNESIKNTNDQEVVQGNDLNGSLLIVTIIRNTSPINKHSLTTLLSILFGL